MPKLNKWECADLWAKVCGLQTADLKALCGKIITEVAARTNEKATKPKKPGGAA